MVSRISLFASFAKCAVLASVILSASLAICQLDPVSPPVADPADTRFNGVKEDWATPSLSGSSLRPATPLTGYVNDHDGYTVELTQVQWRFGDPLDLYVIKPKGVKKPPVILYLYGYPSDTEKFKSEDFQKKVTKGGFAGVGFVSALTGHRYHDRPMREWFVSEFQECLAASAHDVQMVLNYLSTRDDLDMNRVGMFAQGSGASIAILTSAVDARIKVLDALDPWGDWPTWMKLSPFVPEDERHDYLTKKYLDKVAPLDPVTWLPKVQAQRFRMQDALFDVNTPSASKEKLRAAVPKGSDVTLYKSVVDFNSMVRSGKELEWIETQLLAIPQEQHTAALPAMHR
jgi:hypothetical protein